MCKCTCFVSLSLSMDSRSKPIILGDTEENPRTLKSVLDANHLLLLIREITADEKHSLWSIFYFSVKDKLH